MWPAVPPPARTTCTSPYCYGSTSLLDAAATSAEARERRARSSAGARFIPCQRRAACRVPSIVGSSADPPYDTSGSGTPVMGSSPSDRADVDQAPAPAPTRSLRRRPVGRTVSRRAKRHPHARRSRAAPSRASTARVPTRPSSSPMIAKMKSVCASGRAPHFSLDAAETDAPPAAGGERELPCSACSRRPSGSAWSGCSNP